MVFRCCVKGCVTKANGLHRFPTNPNVRLQWIQKTKSFHLEEKLESNSHYRVCDLHFQESDFMTYWEGKKRLLKNSIPTMNLPKELPIYLEHNYTLNSKIRKPPKHLNQQKKPHVNKTVSDGDNAEDDQFSCLYSDPNEIEIDANEIETDKNMEMLFHSLNFLQKEDSNTCIFDVHETGVKMDIEMDVEMDIEMVNGLEPPRPERSNNLDENKEPNSTVEKPTPKKPKQEKKPKQQTNKKRAKTVHRKLRRGKWSDNEVIRYVGEIFNEQQLEFFKMQIENSNREPNGRRYSPEQKSLCLALYKQGPRCYRFMQKIFALPDKRTLARHSADLLFESGIDYKLFEAIKVKVNTLSEIDKYCIISWDEQSLKSHLDYSLPRDLIDGFVDIGFVRRPTFATHALTFAVGGINLHFKQFVAYFYTDGLKAFELAELIRLVTGAVLDTGLKVIGSVCDQISTNVAAVRNLIDPRSRKTVPCGELLTYKIRDSFIIHCYDPPHLIKVIRNNLMKKNLKHYITKRWDRCSDSKNVNREQRALIASWDDVKDLYKFNLIGTERPLEKITDEHIAPLKRKMKVSVATQVFSETYGKFMNECSKTKQFPRDLSGTSQILFFFNDLFDSINGSGRPQKNMLTGSVEENSIHFLFWDYALTELSKMSFVNKLTGEVNNNSTVIKKFMSTIRGYMEITKICLKANMKEVSLRNANQDGLENLFGCIKICCRIGSSPIATQFRSGYTTTIINNLNSAHSIYSNCEADSSVPLVNNVNEFLLDYKNTSSYDNNRLINKQSSSNDSQINNNECEAMENVIFDPKFSADELHFSEDTALNCTSSVICRKLLEITDCEFCIEMLQTTSDPIEASTNFRTRNPSANFTKNFKNLYCATRDIIPHLCSQKLLKKNILIHLETSLEIDPIGCPEHDTTITMKLKEFSVHHGIISFCKEINSILAGKITIIPPNFNHMQELALNFRMKKKRIGKHSDIFDT